MLTLLLDLDDTLLHTNIEAFIPAYFQKLAAHLASFIPPETLLKQLMIGTRQMLANRHPRQTLREVFDAHFYPFLKVDPERLLPAIETFYDEVFPSLRQVTRPVPGAVEVVEWAFAQGYRVAIATNPLFPRKAIYHRLRWAGLPPETYPFALVSTYETFHFTKPQPAYYAEVLGRLGWPEGPVLMVGNDVEADLKPAAALGLATFHTLDVPLQMNRFTPTGRGYLADLRSWLERTDLTTLVPAFSTPGALLALLRSTPAALTGLLDPIPPSAWRQRPASGDWSVVEVLCHLRDVEREVDQPRLRRILTEDEPFLPAETPDDWASTRRYQDQDGPSALEEFATQRLETLDLLEPLSADQWGRKARHTLFGPTTLQELVSFNAEHDRLHVRQVWEVLQEIGERSEAS